MWEPKNLSHHHSICNNTHANLQARRHVDSLGPPSFALLLVFRFREDAELNAPVNCLQIVLVTRMQTE